MGTLAMGLGRPLQTYAISACIELEAILTKFVYVPYAINLSYQWGRAEHVPHTILTQLGLGRSIQTHSSIVDKLDMQLCPSLTMFFLHVFRQHGRIQWSWGCLL